MSVRTVIKITSMGTLAIYNSKHDLIATSEKLEDGRYAIYIFGGAAHGKIAYATDFQDLNDKSVEIANLPTS